MKSRKARSGIERMVWVLGLPVVGIIGSVAIIEHTSRPAVVLAIP
jgi:hypothetical protein